MSNHNNDWLNPISGSNLPHYQCLLHNLFDTGDIDKATIALGLRHLLVENCPGGTVIDGEILNMAGSSRCKPSQCRKRFRPHNMAP
jgi:hypothetical protein